MTYSIQIITLPVKVKLREKIRNLAPPCLVPGGLSYWDGGWRGVGLNCDRRWREMMGRRARKKWGRRGKEDKGKSKKRKRKREQREKEEE